MRRTVVVGMLCLCASAGFAATVRIEDHGAVGDGVTLNSVAIQAAIDACAAAGGGVVTLGPGRFLCGSVELRSHVTLRLDPDAVLLGSDRFEDYPRFSLLRAKWGR